MKELTMNDVQKVNGGCAQHCWGDVNLGEIAGNTIGGMIAGSRGGLGGAVLGGIGAGVGTLLSQLWN